MKVENPQSCLPIRSRKWALKCCMVTSAAFLRWHPGGTSSIVILYLSLIIVFIASDTSLSRMCFFGRIPACCKRVIITQYALASSWSFLLLMGSTKIALLSISTPLCICCLVGIVWENGLSGWRILFRVCHILA